MPWRIVKADESRRARAHVIDGDVLSVSGVHVGLQGVAAPARADADRLIRVWAWLSSNHEEPTTHRLNQRGSL
jgi:hypothetical protein